MTDTAGLEVATGCLHTAQSKRGDRDVSCKLQVSYPAFNKECGFEKDAVTC